MYPNTTLDNISGHPIPAPMLQVHAAFRGEPGAFAAEVVQGNVGVVFTTPVVLCHVRMSPTAVHLRSK